VVRGKVLEALSETLVGICSLLRFHLLINEAII
jgi:hypothetical protein